MLSTAALLFLKKGLGKNEIKIEQSLAKSLNPVLNVTKDGFILYSNESGELLLQEWGIKIGEKLPSSIVDLVQKVISGIAPKN